MQYGQNVLGIKAIMPDGTLVAPGTAGTMKVNSVAAGNLTSNNLGAAIIDTKLDKPAYTGSDVEL